jgi:hypothetical protein
MENGFEVYFRIWEICRVGPACRSLSCCVPCPDWLSWATFPVSTHTIITRSERALSEAATPTVRGQCCCPRHHMRTSASAPPHLPVASHRRLSRPSRPHIAPFFVESLSSPRRLPLFLWPSPAPARHSPLFSSPLCWSPFAKAGAAGATISPLVHCCR